MTGITVHGIPGSPFLRTVEIVLKEKDAPYHLRAMSPADMRTPEHLGLHPFGRIPIFEQGDFRLYETQAIIRYLDDIFPHPRLTPEDPGQRARMNQVIGIIEWYFFPKAAAPIAFNRIIGPRLLGLPADETAIAEAMPIARTCFGELDRLLADKPYFTGDAVSLADIMLGAQLALFEECNEGRELILGTAALPGWLGRMCERPSFLATQPPAVLREAA
ncbi:MAG TPA: glutathione S-transferase family protein [Sphingomicrobium sp.]|jgi:glutathione S-transferase|nr:glutathione S-transferase family protein [Sphingomicrobium sp.]